MLIAIVETGVADPRCCHLHSDQRKLGQLVDIDRGTFLLLLYILRFGLKSLMQKGEFLLCAFLMIPCNLSSLCKCQACGLLRERRLNETLMDRNGRVMASTGNFLARAEVLAFLMLDGNAIR